HHVADDGEFLGVLGEADVVALAEGGKVQTRQGAAAGAQVNIELGSEDAFELALQFLEVLLRLGDGGDGSGGGGLKEPKQGSFDKTIKEYDDAIAKAQKDFQELQGKFESVLASKFDIHLGTGGGSLPCWDFTALGQRYDVCLTQYAQELSVIRYVVLFIAAILAGWIVFYRS
ncbi:hypothetical protein, partial [Pseudomonas aeruginosa]